ncbi:MAG TPA: SGNH/GDSL hydrolase family protein [Bacteroidia bacterium]|nr:SGNH/GDSL hydrolase family protein [Bacteroidia bacterium]
MRVLLPVLILICTSCMSQDKKTIRYVALGDSYTIGTGAEENEAWPVLLTKHLNDKGLVTKLIANPARNGFSTQNLIDLELPVFDSSKADFVTLLIGVNDWVRGVDTVEFSKNLNFILNHLQEKLVLKKNILLVTIPDFGVTPQGSRYSGGRDISAGITEYNDIIKAEAKKRGLICMDIFPLSQKMKNNPSLVADDGLHPSAKEYAEWEKLIFTEVYKVLSGN